MKALAIALLLAQTIEIPVYCKEGFCVMSAEHYQILKERLYKYQRECLSI